jgi:hypothetical protein
MTREERSHDQRNVFVIGIMMGVLALTIMIPTGMAYGQSGDRPAFTIVPRDTGAYGRTYSQWSAAWNQWADSIKVAEHPLFDNGPCDKGQSGPVWFLGGKFCANGANCAYVANRSCSVPYGKALFFPIIDAEDSALEESVNEHPGLPDYQLINYLRSYTTGIDGSKDIFCQIDHQPVQQLQKYGVYSEAFGFTIPDDNLFRAVYPAPNDFQQGTYFPGVDFGYYLMLQPLSPGVHTLHFGASWLDITYQITVGSK